MSRRAPLLILIALLAPAAFAVAPTRHTLVMYKGQRSVVTTAGSVITVSEPPGATGKVVRFRFDQYGSAVGIEAMAPGETKLLVEYTDTRIGEIYNVTVTDQKTWNRYREIHGVFAGVEGMSGDAITVAGDQVLVTGTAYSAADLDRCVKAATPAPARGKKATSPNVVCLARQSSASAAVYPDAGWSPRASVEISEQWQALTDDATEGKESASDWTATVRIGDVPVLMMASKSRTDALGRAARFAAGVNRAAAEWANKTDRSKVPFPVTFTFSQSGQKWAIGMQWKSDQGTRGEVLAELRPEDLELATRSGGSTADQIARWWTALMQDSFRLYFLAQRPSRSLADDEATPLVTLYETALRIAGKLDRATAPVALARGWYSIQLASGTDPFAGMLVRPPRQFGTAGSGA